MQTTTSATQTAKQPRKPIPLNGVDTPALFATIGAVKAQPELAGFTFRATNRWQKGTHSRTRFESFDGAGGTHAHQREFAYDADHPQVLVAAARGVTLHEVESTVEGNIDLRGILGLSDEVRNGYRDIRVSFKIKGDASEQKLREIVEQSSARSAVYDVLTNGVQVAIAVDAA